jgi:hypothetical protein
VLAEFATMASVQRDLPGLGRHSFSLGERTIAVADSLRSSRFPF